MTLSGRLPPPDTLGFVLCVELCYVLAVFWALVTLCERINGQVWSAYAVYARATSCELNVSSLRRCIHQTFGASLGKYSRPMTEREDCAIASRQTTG
jgi:hypothetical protein